MLPILYSFRRCPYAMRARMAINYSGTECELREVVLKNKPESMLKVSPKGTVPVVIDDGQVIDESLGVMDWALAKADPDDWLSQSLKHPLIQRNDQEFKGNLDHYKYFDRYPEQPQSYYFDKGLEFLNELESLLNADANGQYFLEMPKLNVLDVAIFPFIRQFAMVDKSKFDAQDLPKLQEWLEFLLTSTLFLNVMQKYPAWQLEQQDRILFGT
ncbi:MAG: glutathione S-transferase [Arenicella sp.]|nr:glutathione S-transferase [Arenicella sp.]